MFRYNQFFKLILHLLFFCGAILFVVIGDAGSKAAARQLPAERGPPGGAPVALRHDGRHQPQQRLPKGPRGVGDPRTGAPDLHTARMNGLTPIHTPFGWLCVRFDQSDFGKYFPPKAEAGPLN